MSEREEPEVDFDEEADLEQKQEEKKAVKTKGRGHRDTGQDRDRGGVYESVEDDGTSGPAKSIEGWVIIVTGVHEEAQEDEVVDKFSEYGDIKNIQMNLDRRTGFVKGYALIEFGKKSEAEEAIKEMDKDTLYDKEIRVDWAFVKPDQRAGGGGGGGGRRGRQY